MTIAVKDNVLTPFATGGAPQAMREALAPFVRWDYLGVCT
jgi:hypothetical protein